MAFYSFGCVGAVRLLRKQNELRRVGTWHSSSSLPLTRRFQIAMHRPPCSNGPRNALSVRGSLRGLVINGQGIPRCVVWLRSRSHNSKQHPSTTGLRGIPCPYMCPANSLCLRSRRKRQHPHLISLQWPGVRLSRLRGAQAWPQPRQQRPESCRRRYPRRSCPSRLPVAAACGCRNGGGPA